MELCCFSFSSALALSFSSALQWGCCRGGSAGVGGGSRSGHLRVTLGSPSGLVFLIRLVTGRLWDEHSMHLGYPPKFYGVQDAISDKNS